MAFRVHLVIQVYQDILGIQVIAVQEQWFILVLVYLFLQVLLGALHIQQLEQLLLFLGMLIKT